MARLRHERVLSCSAAKVLHVCVQCVDLVSCAVLLETAREVSYQPAV